jgi:hypothetical protein
VQRPTSAFDRRSSADVKVLALAHIEDIERPALELKQMIATLKHLADACEGDHRPHCPIIEELGSGRTAYASDGAKAAARGRRAAPLST